MNLLNLHIMAQGELKDSKDVPIKLPKSKKSKLVILVRKISKTLLKKKETPLP